VLESDPRSFQSHQLNDEQKAMNLDVHPRVMSIVLIKVMMIMNEKKEYQQFQQDHQVNSQNLLQ
jgi:hypothetical protein